MIQCKRCIWFEQCGELSPRSCSHFDPGEEDLEELERERRMQFEEQWEEYLAEY